MSRRPEERLKEGMDTHEHDRGFHDHRPRWRNQAGRLRVARERCLELQPPRQQRRMGRAHPLERSHRLRRGHARLRQAATSSRAISSSPPARWARRSGRRMARRSMASRLPATGSSACARARTTARTMARKRKRADGRPSTTRIFRSERFQPGRLRPPPSPLTSIADCPFASPG
jgi:hypothetical protein